MEIDTAHRLPSRSGRGDARTRRIPDDARGSKEVPSPRSGMLEKVQDLAKHEQSDCPTECDGKKPRRHKVTANQ
jgi:hypothetical protein